MDPAPVDRPPVDQPPVDQPPVDQPPVDQPSADARRRTLWQTSWGVVLAASAAFSLGYGASRSSHPSVGASRPPAWPLFISLAVVAVSLWFVLAPQLHRWPFEERPETPATDAPEGWLAELTDADDR